MKSRISFGSVLTDPLHPLRIILMIAVFSVAVYAVEQLVISRSSWQHVPPGLKRSYAQFTGQPQVLAAGVRVREGIDRFAGRPEQKEWRGELTILLIQLVLAFIIGPTLLLWGLMSRARWYEEPHPRRGSVRIMVALVVGGFFVLSQAVTVIQTIETRQLFSRMVEDNIAAAERDAMVSEAVQMGRNAQGRYFLPLNEGGCGMSWQNRGGSGRPAISIAEIRSPELPTVKILGDAYPQKPKDYLLEIYRPDSLGIVGTGDSPALRVVNDSSFAAGGSPNRSQVRVDVTPDNVTVTYVR